MQCCVIGVLKPTLDKDAVVWLQREVFSHVVHNDGLVKGSPYATEIFDEDHAGWAGVLSVQAILNVFGLVDRVEHPVSVVLHRCCKDDNFVQFSHFSKELLATGTNAEVSFTTLFIVMHKGFIEIEHECVAVRVLSFWEIRSLHNRKRFVPSNGSASDSVKRWQHLFGR